MKFTLVDALNLFGKFIIGIGFLGGIVLAFALYEEGAGLVEILTVLIVAPISGIASGLVFLWMSAMLEAQRYTAESQDAAIEVLSEIDEVLIGQSQSSDSQTPNN